ncbi:hypothetical protein LR48_Vigan03g077800 [Vigna angularis]|uniref:Transmembrane protein n=1 Tax=Phaseolus angularis TaxID=3914 RepID=A0A0L9U3N8_PHAAN|nr:hypothetical protein LR48_Vigan03g077800 [Vigna angularis]
MFKFLRETKPLHLLCSTSSSQREIEKPSSIFFSHSPFASLLHFLRCSISFYCCTALHCLCLDCFRVGAPFALLLSPLHWAARSTAPTEPPSLHRHWSAAVSSSPLLHDALLHDVTLKRARCTSVAASSMAIFLVGLILPDIVLLW